MKNYNIPVELAEKVALHATESKWLKANYGHEAWFDVFDSRNEIRYELINELIAVMPIAAVRAIVLGEGATEFLQAQGFLAA